MRPIELLTEVDKQRLQNYIYTYGCCGNSFPKGEMAPIERVLDVWNHNKQYLLDKVFKDKLIVEVPVEYRMDVDELRTVIQERLYGRSCDPQNSDTIYGKFVQKLRAAVREKNPEYDIWDFDYLFNPWELAKNAFDPYGRGGSFTFPLANGKPYRVNAGTKPMRILNKLSASYGIDGFEEFNTAFSMCLNQKILKGTLCLSIHPMDYITMSDNGHNWDSCMRWRGPGEYRQGTVEMMNSYCVIVGYLKSEKNWVWDSYSCFTDISVDEDCNVWNSKKWRCLFIYDDADRFCLSVKNYPYENDYLTREAVKAITTLAGWETTVHPFENSYSSQEIDGKEVTLHLTTSHMYNDFGDTNHFIALNPNKTDECINDTYYNYSGESQCMWCGSLYVCEGDDENDRVLCDCCETYHRCAWCGDNVEDEYLYEMYDGAMLCEYCMENAASRCPISEQLNLSDNMLELHLYDSETETKYYNNILVLDEVWYNFENQWKEFSSMPQPVLMEYNDWRQEYFVDIHSLTEFGRDCYGLDEEWTELEPMPKNSN